MEKIKDNEIDLRLALGVTNQPVETFTDRDAGANANSRSRTDAILGHRPLPELVWSTQNGLTIKCGGCTSCVAGKTPCALSDEKCMFEESVKSAVGPTVENDGEVKFVHNKGKGKECMSIPVTGTSEENIGLMQDVREPATGGPRFLEKVEETAENDVNAKQTGGDSSGESMESCNSASKKVKRRGFENQLISTSKRLKKQSQECGVVKKQDSSFMNWISNMVKPCQQEKVPHPVEDHKALNKVVSKIFGFQSVFQSLYSPRVEETTAHIESSKEIILFNNPKALSKRPLTSLTSNNNSDVKPTGSASTPMAVTTCFFCGKTGHETRDCLHINENKNAFLKKKVKVSNVNKTVSTSGNMLLNQDKILRIPKEMFDTIRRLRLSRTDILKWMNSRSAVANLEGYFLRLRLSKWEKGVGGAGYYVACITDENPSKGFKQPIRVNIGGVQCLVECRYISNCDFLEDELIAWWRTTLKSGRPLMEEDLTSKLEEKKKLGLSFA
ncbi:putative transcription factor interactor and regulator CCHC(Zn) family [Helianthus annuus]|nr:putative transcription factor interactor and regulator CCHC(Zn) family [Helianthus annuus]